ncbi:MAG TPA: hypothetical protein PK414_09490, partial [Anaerolineales bacterium]|nr:hypothetical protein [Anaerolineales bacterium]
MKIKFPHFHFVFLSVLAIFALLPIPHAKAATVVELVADLYQSPYGWMDSDPGHLAVFNNKLYFSATVGDDRELWVYDGINAPSLAADIEPNGWSEPQYLTAFNGALYFSAYTNDYGRELWKYDGVNAPSMVADINPDSNNSYPSYLTVFNSKLYFSAEDSNGDVELWKYDGVNPPSLAADINPSYSSYPAYLAVFDN